MSIYCILGIGNRLRNDDAAGSIFAEGFRALGWISIDSEVMPDSFTGMIRRHNPELLVIVDTCSMDTVPGTIMRVSPDRIADDILYRAGGLPIPVLIRYLNEFVPEIIFIGIQPENTDFGEKISPEVRRSLIRLSEILKKKDFHEIPFFD